MRHRRIRPGFAVCAAVVLAGGCRAAGVPLAPAGEQDAAVYREVLATAPTRTVLRTTSAPLDLAGEAKERIAMHSAELNDLQPGTVRSFLDQNLTEASLQELGDSTLVWVSEEEWHAWMQQPRESREGGETERWRHGVMRLSRIGYSRDSKQALVYVVHACPLCGSGTYVLLTRVGDRWSIAAEAADWFS